MGERERERVLLRGRALLAAMEGTMLHPPRYDDPGAWSFTICAGDADTLRDMLAALSAPEALTRPPEGAGDHKTETRRAAPRTGRQTMGDMEKLGYRIMLWIARRLLRQSLTDDEANGLRSIATSLAVLRPPEKPVTE